MFSASRTERHKKTWTHLCVISTIKEELQEMMFECVSGTNTLRDGEKQTQILEP